jgi:hypothetical protein
MPAAAQRKNLLSGSARFRQRERLMQIPQRLKMPRRKKSERMRGRL